MPRLLPPGPPSRSRNPPPSVGDYILNEVLPSLDLTVTAAAQRMYTTRQAL